MLSAPYIKEFYQNRDDSRVTFGAEQEIDIFTVTLNTPLNDSLIAATSVTFNSSSDAAPDSLLNSTLHVWYSNGTLISTNKVDSGDVENETIWSNYGSFVDGTYKWNVWWENDAPNGTFAPSNFTFEIDNEAPVISILNPTAMYYNETNLTFNFNIVEPNLDSCGYILNGAARVELPTCDNSSIVGVVTDVNNLTLIVNDSAGNEAGAQTWYGLFNVSSITFDAAVVELSSHDFVIDYKFDFDLGGGTGSVAVYPNSTLYINGTAIASTNTSQTCGLGECTDLEDTATFNVPANSTASNYSFYFNITYPTATKGDITLTQSSYLSAINYMAADTLNVVPCLANDTVSLNVTCFDEEQFNQVNCTLDYDLEIWSGDRTAYKVINGTSASAHEHYLCILPVYATIYADGLTEYTGTGFELRNYWFTNTTLNNISNALNLYNMNSTLSTLFEIEVQDEFFSPAADRYVQALRYYPELNSYILVEVAKTNFIGTGLMHLYKDNPFYKFFIYDYVTLKKEVSPFKPVCSILPCELLWVEQADFENLFSSVDGVNFNLSWNNDTETFRWTFTDTGGLTTGARLKVEKYTGFGTTELCDNSVSTVSGTILCDVSGNGTGTYLASGYVEQTDEHISETLSAAINPDALIYGNDGMFWAIMVIIVVSIMGLAFGSVMIGFIMPLGVLVLLSMPQIGFIAIPQGVIVGLIIFVFFMWVKMRQ